MLSVHPVRRVLWGNGVFSTVSGVLMLVNPSSIADFMGMRSPVPLILIGVGLLGFACSVFYVASKPITNRTFVGIIIALDLIWVIGSAMVLLTNIFELTQGGSVVVAIVALIVLGFAIGQGVGLLHGTQE
jgi:hypothetical protein